MREVSSRSIRSGRLLAHLLPVLVWVGVIACVVGLLHHRSQRFEVLGVAQAKTYQIAATCTGRLKSVHVQLFDEVKKGQVLAVVNAVLDNERPRPEFEAQLATIRAQKEHLAAASNAGHRTELATVDNRRSDWIARRRTFANDVMDTRFSALELSTQIKTNEAVLEELELNKKMLMTQVLSDHNDVKYYEWRTAKAQYNTLVKQINEDKGRLERFQEELKEAKDREAEFINMGEPYAGSSNDEANDIVLKAAKVLDQQMNELEVQLAALDLREALELRSPIDGVVVHVHDTARDVPGEYVLGKQGDVVIAGEPILTVVEGKPSEILAYATEEQVSRTAAGKAVDLIKDTAPPQIVRSKVVYIGPVVEQIPVRLWRNPNMPQWGRPILIEMPDVRGFKLVPGELVGVRGL